MDKIALDFGFIKIYWYSLFVLAGFIVGGIMVFLEAKRQKIKEDVISDLIFYTVLVGLLGARVYYVLFNLSYYLAHPLEIVAIWKGGLAIHGGILASLIFIVYYCKKKKINIYKMLDIIVVGLVIGQAIGRWGNFFNQEAYGSVVSLDTLKALHLPSFIINNMFILGKYRIPTFFYESISCLICFIIMLLIRKFYKNLKVKSLSGFYLVWYGFTRFFIEYFRSDSLMLFNIKVAMIISFFFIVVGFYFLFQRYKSLYQEAHIYVNK